MKSKLTKFDISAIEAIIDSEMLMHARILLLASYVGVNSDTLSQNV